MKKKLALLYNFFFLMLGSLIAADSLQVFQEPNIFVTLITQKDENTPKYIWITKEIQKEISDILGHPFSALRIRYWEHQKSTIWVLEEIGKTEPITFGYLIENKTIKKASVLIFRESRGGEIHNEFFTKQFIDCELTEKKKLSKKVDGITGATLSVNAMRKTAALALYLNTIALTNATEPIKDEK